jgi:hypothetical protein
VVAEPERREEFLRRSFEYLQTGAPGWDELRLTNLPEPSPTASILKGLARASGLHAQIRPAGVGPVLDLAGAEPGVIAQLLEKKGIARKAKALSRRGRLEFAVLREEAEIKQALGDFYRFHTVRYLLCGQPSLFDPEQGFNLCRLFELLVEKLSPLRRVCVPALFFDGRLVALYFGLEHRGRLMLYATAFDVGLVGTSPGEILALEVTRYCWEAGIRRLDFGVGDEPYKFRFTNRLRRNCELVIHRRALASFASAAYARSKAWARRRPALRRVVRQGKQLWRMARMETRRVGVRRAAGSLSAEGARCLARLIRVRPRPERSPKEMGHFSLAALGRQLSLVPEGSHLSELRARDFMAMVMAHRQAFPGWYFRRALDYLRRGHRCFLAEAGKGDGSLLSQRDGSLLSAGLAQIIWVCERNQSEAGRPVRRLGESGLAIYEVWTAPGAVPDNRARTDLEQLLRA